MKNENMSPLLYYTQKQSEKISKLIKKENLLIDFAMRYGNPSIKSKIYKLQEQGCENLVILPLYPQYAAATTATVCDEVYRTLMEMRWQPSLKIIPHYESDPLYINALVKSINKNVRSSTRKLNPILKSIVGKKVDVAIRDLTFSEKRISKDIKKTISSVQEDLCIRNKMIMVEIYH